MAAPPGEEEYEGREEKGQLLGVAAAINSLANLRASGRPTFTLGAQRKKGKAIFSARREAAAERRTLGRELSFSLRELDRSAPKGGPASHDDD